jgi:hypothetical protein
MMPTKTSAVQNEVVRIGAVWLPPPLRKNALSVNGKIGFGGPADAAEMRNRFAFAVATFS